MIFSLTGVIGTLMVAALGLWIIARPLLQHAGPTGVDGSFNIAIMQLTDTIDMPSTSACPVAGNSG